MMRRSIVWLTVVAAVFPCLHAAGVALAADAVRIAVVYRDAPDPARLALQEARGRRVVHRFSHLPAASLEVAAEEASALLDDLAADPGVRAAAVETRSQRISAQTVPWGVSRVKAPAVHLAGNTGAGVRVAVLDTGVDDDHPDLVGAYAGGISIVQPEGCRSSVCAQTDDHGHGTHVAGIVAAADNNVGVVGVAPGVALYAAKVLDKDGLGFPSDFAKGLDWAIDNGMQVAIYSAGGDVDPAGIMKEACDRARAAGLTVVAAAGNFAPSPIDLPAAYDSVVAVGAIDASNVRAEFSEFGPELDFVAPGVEILSTSWSRLEGSGYDTLTGTSMAAPHVAGALALVLAGGVTDPAEALFLLAFRAKDLGPTGRDDDYGLGLVNARSALLSTGYITSPAGGESIPAGTTFPVSWDPPPGAASFNVFLSTDGGRTRTQVTPSPVAGAGYDWYVNPPAGNRSGCLLRVVAYDAAGKVTGIDETPLFFIRVVDLVAPAAGSEIVGGLPTEIRWTTHGTVSPVARVRLLYTPDGLTWRLLTTLEGDPGSSTWTPPAVNRPRRRYQIRVVLKNSLGKTVGKVTSGRFAIVP